MIKSTIGTVQARAWASSEHLDPETLQRTVEACAWLIGIAEQSVKSHDWDSSVVRWLDGIGSAAYETLQKELQ